VNVSLRSAWAPSGRIATAEAVECGGRLDLTPYILALFALAAVPPSSPASACDAASIAVARRAVKTHYEALRYEDAITAGSPVLSACASQPPGTLASTEVARLWLLSDVALALSRSDRDLERSCDALKDWRLPEKRPAAAASARAWKALAFNYASVCHQCDPTIEPLCRDGSWTRKGYAEIPSGVVHPSLPPMRFRAVFSPDLDDLKLARVEVAEAATGRLLQSLDGQDEGFIEVLGGEDSVLSLGDPNFDGYQDIIVGWCETLPSCGQAVWLYDPDARRFARHDQLSGISHLMYDPRDKSVRASSGDNQVHIEELYEWRGKDLTLLERVTTTHEGTVVERLVGGVLKVVEKRAPAP
jgi:hypothetical protein